MIADHGDHANGFINHRIMLLIKGMRIVLCRGHQPKEHQHVGIIRSARWLLFAHKIKDPHEERVCSRKKHFQPSRLL
ncbi:MAG: hypothetical protein CJBNEKGG_00696 [Prosthecobacter sp.]|nr:hypothetical protein [Prosthecobacter sp.]